MGASASGGGARGRDGQVHGRAQQRRLHRGRPPGRAGLGRARQLAVSGFLPVGYYKDPEKTARTFRDVRRPALVGAGRLRDGRGRRQPAAARPRLAGDQHRRREGLSRGGRGGDQALSRACATRRWSACPTAASASASARWSTSARPSPQPGRRSPSTSARTWPPTRRRASWCCAPIHRAAQRQARLQGRARHGPGGAAPLRGRAESGMNDFRPCAASWCQTRTRRSMAEWTAWSATSTRRYRTFSIKSGDAMYVPPDLRVRIW